MQIRKIVLGFVAVSILAGCSLISEREKVDYKAGGTQVRPLEIPPDLTTPTTDVRYTILGSDEKAANYSEYLKEQQKTNGDASKGTPSALGVPLVPDSILREDSKGVKSIMLNEPFDRSWRKVGLALEKMRSKINDKDREKGIYFLGRADRDGKKVADFQVKVHETPDGTEVVILNGDGKDDPDTAGTIKVLYQSLQSLNEKTPAAGDSRRGKAPPSGGSRRRPGGSGAPSGDTDE